MPTLHHPNRSLPSLPSRVPRLFAVPPALSAPRHTQRRGQQSSQRHPSRQRTQLAAHVKTRPMSSLASCAFLPRPGLWSSLASPSDRRSLQSVSPDGLPLQQQLTNNACLISPHDAQAAPLYEDDCRQTVIHAITFPLRAPSPRSSPIPAQTHPDSVSPNRACYRPNLGTRKKQPGLRPSLCKTLCRT